MIAAVILHNMIIEEERDTPMANLFDYHQTTPASSSSNTSSSTSNNLEMFLLQFQAVQSRSTHHMLKEDLINHLWNKCGDKNNAGDKHNAEDSNVIKKWFLFFLSHLFIIYSLLLMITNFTGIVN
jgi:hypothetical protein